MNKKKIKDELKKNKYKYAFLITIIIVGFISGIICSNILSYNDQKEISEIVKTYFINLKNGEEINYFNNLLNNTLVNYFYLVLLFVFGLSIIGIILNPFILYFKSFILGFSVGIVINIYSFKGIVFGILYLFPHQIINLITNLISNSFNK